jgi:hypothetical protein
MNNNRGWKIYNKMPRDIQDLMSIHLMNNTREYFRNNVAPYLIEKAMKKNKICCIIDYYKNKYNVLNIDYIYNLLERDLLEWIKDICWGEDQFEIFINKIFNDKNIDNIKEKYKSTYVVHKILINLSYDNMVKFEKMNTLN